MNVGVISDTHGLLREQATAALVGSELILHAGDVGKPEVLDALREIAPLVAVRGNVDRGDWADELPETADVELGPFRAHLLHNVGMLEVDPREFDAVIAGHSHQPLIERRDSTLFLNPGSAGPRRFRLPIALALLTVTAGGIAAEIVEINR